MGEEVYWHTVGRKYTMTKYMEEVSSMPSSSIQLLVTFGLPINVNIYHRQLPLPARSISPNSSTWLLKEEYSSLTRTSQKRWTSKYRKHERLPKYEHIHLPQMYISWPRSQKNIQSAVEKLSLLEKQTRQVSGKPMTRKLHRLRTSRLQILPPHQSYW